MFAVDGTGQNNHFCRIVLGGDGNAEACRFTDCSGESGRKDDHIVGFFRDDDIDLLPGPLCFQRHIALDVLELTAHERRRTALNVPTLELISLAGRLGRGNRVALAVLHKLRRVGERNVDIRCACKERHLVAADRGGAVVRCPLRDQLGGTCNTSDSSTLMINIRRPFLQPAGKLITVELGVLHCDIVLGSPAVLNLVEDAGHAAVIAWVKPDFLVRVKLRLKGAITPKVERRVGCAR